MTKLGAAGALNAAFFFAGTAAHDADDHVVYKPCDPARCSTTATATRPAASPKLATLTNHPVLAANDFVVI